MVVAVAVAVSEDVVAEALIEFVEGSDQAAKSEDSPGKDDEGVVELIVARVVEYIVE